LHGKQPGQADCVIFSFIHQLHHRDAGGIIDQYDVPNVVAWVEQISDAEFFQQVVRKVDVWSD
jgi:glutathione S-transferase